MSAIGKLIGGMFKTPKMPDMPTMPDPGSAAAKVAARKKIDAKKTTGREGTIYTPYANTALGGTR